MNSHIDDAGVPDDDHPFVEGPPADLRSGLPSDLLDDPGLWADTDQATEDSIVAAIASEIATTSVARSAVVEPVPVQASAPAEVVRLPLARRWLGPAAAGAAAALVLVAGFVLSSSDDSDLDAVEVALAPTEIAPEAEAVAKVAETPLGTRIVLDVSGLPPAAPGTYYEAWLRVDADVGVSAGTFHLRGGDGEIELWSGVAPVDYPLLTVTVQDEGDAASSGVVVLRGRIDG